MKFTFYVSIFVQQIENEGENSAFFLIPSWNVLIWVRFFEKVNII